tara:strand:+ start:2435 stop:3574 length:1140 start_codon:yes stop_codon:yes gene_type:complete
VFWFSSASTATPEGLENLERDTFNSEQYLEFAEQIKSSGITENIDISEYRDEARNIYNQALNGDLGELKLPDQPIEKRSDKVFIFASLSLGKVGINKIIAGANSIENSVIVFRGIPKGMNLGEGILKIKQLANNPDSLRNIIIDPTIFTRYAVETVPQIVITDESGKSIARVKGLNTPGWLMSQIENGNFGDFGAKGVQVEILEPDLIEEAKRRMALIDWDEKKKAAAERFWSNQKFYSIPSADEDKTRELDPSIYISDNIAGANGEIIARKGDVINPLHIRPFDQVVVVFNPTKKREFEFVSRMLNGLKSRYGKVVLIATELEKESGWDGYKELTDSLESPVYMLTSDVYTRFKIEKTPTMVSANQDYFIIDEYKVVE